MRQLNYSPCKHYLKLTKYSLGRLFCILSSRVNNSVLGAFSEPICLYFRQARTLMFLTKLMNFSHTFIVLMSDYCKKNQHLVWLLMESLSIKDDDLYEKPVVVPGKRTILQTTPNVFLSGIGNLKQYQVYINRICDFFFFFYSIFQQKLFLHTDSYEGCDCLQRNVSLGNLWDISLIRNQRLSKIFRYTICLCVIPGVIFLFSHYCIYLEH